VLFIYISKLLSALPWPPAVPAGSRRRAPPAPIAMPLRRMSNPYPGGVTEGSQGLERSVNPGTIEKQHRILKGCETVIMALIVALASRQDANPNHILTRIFRSPPSPGYLLQPFGVRAMIQFPSTSVGWIGRNPQLHLFFKNHQPLVF
jgi:hypothetical protein